MRIIKNNGKKSKSQNRNKRILLFLMLVCVALAAVADVLIRVNIFPYLVVSDTYIDVVFSALCTVAVLGSAIQSIIIGSFNSKIYGLTLKEVLSERPSKINVSETVKISFLSILIGLLFYAFSFCSAITATTVCIVIFITESSIQIWRLLSSEETQLRVLNEIIDSNNQPPEYYYARWFPEVKKAIENNDEVLLDTYVKLIYQINETGNGTPSIEKNIKDVFPLATLHIGFVDAYKKIIGLGEWQNKTIDAYSIVRSYFLQIKFCNEQQIGQYRIPETIDDILERMEVADDEKLRFVYWLYSNLKNNQIISQIVRNSIISAIYSKLSYLRDSEDGELRKQIILFIFKRDILENENIDERKELMQMLNASLFHNNRYSQDGCYISLLAQLFRGIFFYSFYETENLNSDYRKELSTLFQYGKAGRDNYRITLSGLVSEKSESIVVWLSDDCKADSYHLNSMFEYFSANYVVKRSVWTVENRVAFAFGYYLLVGYCFRLSPITKIIQNDEIDINHRIRLCKCVTSCFDDEGQLIENYKSALAKLRSFTGANPSLEDSLGSDNFEFFNERLGELSKRHNAGLVANMSNSIAELNSKIIEKCSSFQGLKYSNAISFDNATVSSISPIIRHVFKDDVSYVADKEVNFIKQIVNNKIDEILPKIQLSFDQKGVAVLLKELEKSRYKARNYAFENDWALSKEVISSEEYKKLIELLSVIPFFGDSDIHRRIFIKEEQINFNAKVLSYRTEKPTDAQCEEYIASFKVADGKYRIDGANLNYEKAIDYVKNAFIVEYSEISVVTSLNSESGFVIDFSFGSKK